MSAPSSLDAAASKPARAASNAIVGIGLLCLMDALVKGVAARYPLVEVAFLRFAFGSIAAAAAWAAARPPAPSREALRVNFARALLVVATAVCFFYAIRELPLAEAVALSFLSPILMALFAALLLRERIDGRIGLALAIGFSGMLVIVFGGAAEEAAAPRNPLGVAAAFVSAVTYALAMVLLRARATKDGVVTVVALQNVFPALILALPAAASFVAPTGPDLALFAAIGALGAGGHLLLARAFRSQAAARLAPLEYTALLWGALFGYAMFAEVPGPATLVGAAMIAAGAAAVSRR